MKLADARSPPIRHCLLHLRQVQVAGAEEVGAAVPHFQLEFGVAAEVAQVVAGKGVAQGILLPAVGGGVPAGPAAQAVPVLPPVRRADAVGVVLPVSL